MSEMKIKDGYFEQQRTLKNSTSATELSGIPIAERAQVVKTAQLICPTVVNWIKEYPVILPVRVPSTCLFWAATSPVLEHIVITEAALLSFVVFAIDDIADGVIGLHTNEQIEDLLTFYTNIVQSGGANYHSYPHFLNKFTNFDDSQPWLQTAKALAKCCQEILTFPSASASYHFFVKHFSLCMESMRVELQWRQDFEQTQSLPTYEQYLKNGRESVALSALVAGVLAMVQELPVDAKLESSQFDLESLLDELILTYSASIRLANDVRGFERERIENKPNSLLILMLANSLTEKEAEAIALKEMENYRDKADSMLPWLPESLQVWGSAVKRLTWFCTEFFKIREFHHFSKEMLAELARST